MVRFAALAFIVCLHAVTSACSSRATPAEPPAPAAPRPDPVLDDCALIAGPGEPVTTVGLGERVDPANAPHPSNESERLLFRQLYETLVRVDCHGRVAPGLASSWQFDPQGRAWIVTLREQARFSDGTLVTAADVRAGWTRDDAGDELQPKVSRLVESVVARDDRTLAITLRSQGVDAPLALAHTDMAVARIRTGSPWPIGTRSSRIASVPAPDAAAADAIVLERDGLAPVRFLASRHDPRDLLDEGVDLLLTRDPAALDYAATLVHFHSVPLAWRRTYVLLAAGRARTPPALSDEARQALADDAVRGEARGAQGPFWWQAQPDCEISGAPLRNGTTVTPRIVYDAADAAARDLAGRLVGLAAYRRATGLSGEALTRARRLGTDAGYVMSLESRPVDPCRELQVLIDSAPWLDPATIVPLVDTRLQAIVRRGRSGVTVEWDGGLLLGPANNPDER